jgi:hypothetical protein
MKRPLEGIRILDMTAWLSGPYAMEIVAYLGAEVINLEKADGGDAVRANGPYFARMESFSKRKTPPGRASASLREGREGCARHAPEQTGQYRPCSGG